MEPPGVSLIEETCASRRRVSLDSVEDYKQDDPKNPNKGEMEVDDPKSPDREALQASLATFSSPRSPFLTGQSGSNTSSPIHNQDCLEVSPLSGGYLVGGKPLYRRGPGRPRKDGRLSGFDARKTLGFKLKKPASIGYTRSSTSPKMPKKPSYEDSMISTTPECIRIEIQESPPRVCEDTAESDTSSVISSQEKLPEEIVGFQEHWPGKECAFCNLGERSPLGQGEMICVEPPVDFDLSKVLKEERLSYDDKDTITEKNIKAPLQWKKQKSIGKNKRNSIQGTAEVPAEVNEDVDVVGFIDEPAVSTIFDITGNCYVHHNCAVWSNGVVEQVKDEDSILRNVHKALLKAVSDKCTGCQRYGASVTCHVDDCTQVFHFPCAASYGAFQFAAPVPTIICSNHLEFVHDIVGKFTLCTVCGVMGDIANLVFCVSCCNHYHGTCLDLNLLVSGIRAGWLCPACKSCQICRQSEEGRSLVYCDTCEKAFHTTCLRPILASFPKHGWKCKSCRVCTDCGSKTPGSGPSSRWHVNFSVCDSCYQQRNKGLACPLCGKAYRHCTQREMVQCIICKKYVHGHCDPAANINTYRQRKDQFPSYEYTCRVCKVSPPVTPPSTPKSMLRERRERSGLSEMDLVYCDSYNNGDYSYYGDIEGSEKLAKEGNDCVRSLSLYRGKPLGTGNFRRRVGAFGRPKGEIGEKLPGMTTVGGRRANKMAVLLRKRGPKPKMRGLFGVPGVGLQRPVMDLPQMKSDEEPGVENRLVLCSAKDEFTLKQDVCVMCGAYGNDQEGRLIACAHCGQCYHPYCVNIRVTKVILQKGWRCLDCTVCEGCGQRNDEARLILCDDCDISYHTYCMDPPLDYVPQGNWKCKWCAICLVCGSNDPGFNSMWQRSYTLCGPCASYSVCSVCTERYLDGELVIQCRKCYRWLHCLCDSIKTDNDAEKCIEEIYNCLLCRPTDLLPPHLIPPPIPPKPPTPQGSPEVPRLKSHAHYFVDGICLSEMGMFQIKSQTPEQPKKKRRRVPTADTEAGILAAIESVVAGDHPLEHGDGDRLPSYMSDDISDMLKHEEKLADGYAYMTGENGEMIIKKKRQRNLQKLGIGGFIVRPRAVRLKDKDEDIPGDVENIPSSQDIVEKPKRKPQRRKQKSKLMENFPSYLQEAFFGKDLLDCNQDGDIESESDVEENTSFSQVGDDMTVKLSQEELKAMEAIKARQEHEKDTTIKSDGSEDSKNDTKDHKPALKDNDSKSPIKEEDEEDVGAEEALKDILPLPGDLLDNDLVDTIMNEGDDITKNEELDGITEDGDLGGQDGGSDTGEQGSKDELTDFLTSQFNLDSMVEETCLPNMDGKDVEDIFKGVLTDESQESQDSAFSMTGTPSASSHQTHPLTQTLHANINPVSMIQPGGNLSCSTGPVNSQHPVQQGISSPMSFPPPSPYHSEYSNSPQFSPAFSEPPSPWPQQPEHEGPETPSYSQRSILKWESDEGLGPNATISAVLYANMNCHDLKRDYPAWSERVKQISKIWRSLSTDLRAPYLQKARDNRANNRIQKVQQDQEKLLHPKKPLELDEELHWKQLQALRQQQAQQHQRVLQEQRIQAIVQVQRQLTEENAEILPPEHPVITPMNQLQVVTPGDLSGTSPHPHSSPHPISSPHSSPHPHPSPLLPSHPLVQQSQASPGARTPTFTSPIQVARVRPPIELSASYHTVPIQEFGDSRTSQMHQVPKLPLHHKESLVRIPFEPIDSGNDPYNKMSSSCVPTPSQPLVIMAEDRLRDLLQRQQVVKKIEQPWDQGGSIDKTLPEGNSPLQPPISHFSAITVGAGSRFRQPFIPVTQTRLTSDSGGVDMRQQMPLDQASKLLNARTRFLIQHQVQRNVSPQMVRAPMQVVPLESEISQTPMKIQQDRIDPPRSVQPVSCVGALQTRPPQKPLQNIPSQTIPQPQTQMPRTVELKNLAEPPSLLHVEDAADSGAEGEGPELADIVVDEDELLGMAGDFNILEYADPELIQAEGGKKTNILDDFDEKKEENKEDKDWKKRKDSNDKGGEHHTPFQRNVGFEASIPTPGPSVPPGLATPSNIDQNLLTVQSVRTLPNQQVMQQTIRLPIVTGQIPGRHLPMRLAMPPPPQLQSQGGDDGLDHLGGMPFQSVIGGNQPPPPYPLPPPPYPGRQQLHPPGLGIGLLPRLGNLVPPISSPLLPPRMTYVSRPSLAQEQPLLLEDLLEQEKREQQKLQQKQQQERGVANEDVMLNEIDFEKLHADVLGTTNPQITTPSQALTGMVQLRPSPATPVPPLSLIPAPPQPPENPTTEQDHQQQIQYEKWLYQQQQLISAQLKYYETDVNKLRKAKKSLNSKQRQLRKNGQELNEIDAGELERISGEQAALQKQLDHIRKQSRQHAIVIQAEESPFSPSGENIQRSPQSGIPGLPSPRMHSPQSMSRIIQRPPGSPYTPEVSMVQVSRITSDVNNQMHPALAQQFSRSYIPERTRPPMPVLYSRPPPSPLGSPVGPSTPLGPTSHVGSCTPMGPSTPVGSSTPVTSPIRRLSTNSPSSGESPHTPRTPLPSECTEEGSGGGTCNNPTLPIAGLPPGYFKNFKMGLRGGSPIVGSSGIKKETENSCKSPKLKEELETSTSSIEATVVPSTSYVAPRLLTSIAVPPSQVPPSSIHHSNIPGGLTNASRFPSLPLGMPPVILSAALTQVVSARNVGTNNPITATSIPRQALTAVVVADSVAVARLSSLSSTQPSQQANNPNLSLVTASHPTISQGSSESSHHLILTLPSSCASFPTSLISKAKHSTPAILLSTDAQSKVIPVRACSDSGTQSTIISPSSSSSITTSVPVITFPLLSTSSNISCCYQSKEVSHGTCSTSSISNSTVSLSVPSFLGSSVPISQPFMTATNSGMTSVLLTPRMSVGIPAPTTTSGEENVKVNKVEPLMSIQSESQTQNVLLKQLLQNTACATTSQSIAEPFSLSSSLAQISVPVTCISSIPSQPLARPSISITPPVIKIEPGLATEGEKLSPRDEVEVKKEVTDCKEESCEVSSKLDIDIMLADNKKQMDEEIKKAKRRQYQQKRRQSLGKEPAGPKKRIRKGSKMEEDYDSFIEGLMGLLRTLPPISITEPVLERSFSMCPAFGTGDLSKIGNCDHNFNTGDLTGCYGNSSLLSGTPFYDTQPFGELPTVPAVRSTPTQMGFYNQEFSSPKLETAIEKSAEQSCSTPDSRPPSGARDSDTPNTIISSSSPECAWPEAFVKFPGLRLIDDDEDEKDVECRASPVIPIIVPLPIRPKPGTNIHDIDDLDKENQGLKRETFRTRFGLPTPAPLRDTGNVTVTLTLSSAAAENVTSVLSQLAGLLQIDPPSNYQVVERTTTPPSQKLGLYRTKGKDGKEGAPVDIQSILNGEAKFCRHCDVVILSHMIRKKISELPFLSKEEAENGEEIFFCSSTCYVQFALAHRSVAVEEKAATVVDHLSDNCSQIKGLKSVDIEKDDKHNISLKLTHIKKFEDELDMDSSGDTLLSDDVGIFSEKKGKRPLIGDDCLQPPCKKYKEILYKHWSPNMTAPQKYKKTSDKEMTEMLFRLGIAVMPPKLQDDTRKCMFCHQIGDGITDGPARLLNYDVDKWVHLNCALWSEEVYETQNGALMNVDVALRHSLNFTCIHCKQSGATVKCFKLRCSSIYHLGCAVKDGCVFYMNKSVYCSNHVQKSEKDNELTTLAVFRRVYINRDENRQVAAVMHHADQNHSLLRVGSLIFLSVGQLLPHQLGAFHTPHFIYPNGYKIVRFYWSMRTLHKRCQYVCSIHEVDNKPEFRILVQENNHEDVLLRDTSATTVWQQVLSNIAHLREEAGTIKLFPQYIAGEDLFGLTEPSIVRVLESLPGIETLIDYHFKYGRNPLLELPLAINPTGCARSEPKLRTHFKRPHTQRTGSSARTAYTPAAISGEPACPYSKQFVHSKSSQYKKMKQEWRNNVYLARSKIQGLGLYAARDIEKHTMVIEYIGESIRTELAELREKKYEAINRGIYMFRLDENRVIDATLSGGLARYINHSCNPNCVAEIVEVDRDLRIIIFANRRISRGEELAYDYKFDIEDDQHKIPCLCGAPNCRKWMN